MCPVQGKVCSNCRKQNHFTKVCRSFGANRAKTHQNPRVPVLRQEHVEKEDWERDLPGDMPPLEDIEDNGVFVISCTGGDDGERMPPPVGQVEIEGVKTQALIHTGATVTIIDMSMLRRMTTHPVKQPTKARIYP